MATQNNQIWIGIDENKVILSGQELENYLAQLELDQQESLRLDNELKQQAQLKTELLARLGITENELKVLGL